MIWNFYFLFIIFVNFTLPKINCILNVDNYVNTTGLGLTNISGSLLHNNGSIAFIAFVNGSIYTINYYSIDADGVMTYVNSFISPNNSVKADRLLIYNNKYLIAYQTDGNSFNAFDILNQSFYGNYVMNESIFLFHHVVSKGIILYVNINGQLKYIEESNFLLSNTKIIINNNMSSYPSMSVSPDQNFVAIASSSSQFVYIYQLTNYSVITTFIFPFYATQYSLSGMVWRSNQELILFSQYNCIVYQINIPTGSYNTSTALLVPTCSDVSYHTMFLLNLIYIQATDQIVGAASYMNKFSYSAFFSFSLSSLEITYFTNLSFYSLRSYSNSGDNNLFFSNNRYNSVFFGKILAECQSPYVYDSLIQKCVIIDQKILDFQNFFNNALNNEQFKSLNTIPGGRKLLKPFFTFFINFDDLWLYVYHQREYDIVVNYVFNSIQSLENEKWNFLPIHIIWQFLGLESNNTINQFSSKLNRTSQKFYSVQKNSNGFIINTLTFFCSNIFLMFIIFIIIRILFNLSFNYRISILFRKYSFWSYFLIVMLQGNLQYLTYLFSFEIQNFFSVNFINKFGLGFAVILFFGLFIFSVTTYPVVMYHHGKLVRYFVQNMKLSTFTAFYIAIHMGYRNVLLGFLHSILDSHYFVKIGSLIAIQVVFLLFTLIWLSKKFFHNHLTVWTNILATFLRILLIFTFFFDYQNIQTNIQSVHIQIFYIYISEMLVSIFIQIIRFILQIKKIALCQGRFKPKNQKKYRFKSNFSIKKKRQKPVLKIIFFDKNGNKIVSKLDNISNLLFYKKDQNQNQQKKTFNKSQSFLNKKKVNKMITKKTFNIKKTKENEKPIYLKKNINFRRNNNQF